VKGLSRKTRVETGDSWKKAQGYVDWLGSYHQSAGGLRNMDRDRGVGWFGRRDALWNDSFKSCMLSMRSLSLSLSFSIILDPSCVTGSGYSSGCEGCTDSFF
jgi:hypothetical protein